MIKSLFCTRDKKKGRAELKSLNTKSQTAGGTAQTAQTLTMRLEWLKYEALATPTTTASL